MENGGGGRERDEMVIMCFWLIFLETKKATKGPGLFRPLRRTRISRWSDLDALERKNEPKMHISRVMCRDVSVFEGEITLLDQQNEIWERALSDRQNGTLLPVGGILVNFLKTKKTGK